ncbi:MAG: rhomboid family intramembrane serine protease [Chloroflexota bacterium]
MIFPVGIPGNKDNSRPYMTYLLVGINIIVFIWEVLYTQIYGIEAFNQVMMAIAFNVCEIGTRSTPHLALDSLRSMFLHGGIMHILGNMVFLVIFGRKIEKYFGAIPFLAFYLLAGYGATIAHAMFSGVICTPADPYGLVIGASGAVAGVLGAFLLLFPTMPINTQVAIIPPFIGWNFKVPAMFYLLYFFLMDFVQGLGWYVEEGTNVAYWGHIGGFLFGFLLVFIATIFWKPAPKQDPFAYLDD